MGFVCLEMAQIAHYFSGFSTGMFGAPGYDEIRFAELCSEAHQTGERLMKRTLIH
jgi:hypothetical protein